MQICRGRWVESSGGLGRGAGGSEGIGVGVGGGRADRVVWDGETVGRGGDLREQGGA